MAEAYSQLGEWGCFGSFASECFFCGCLSLGGEGECLRFFFGGCGGRIEDFDFFFFLSFFGEGVVFSGFFLVRLEGAVLLSGGGACCLEGFCC